MKKKNFTLIETIVAISILTVGILGVTNLISQLISATSFSLKRLIAAYLAQEGIEIVRNIRDTNLVKGQNWDSGLETGEWEADYLDFTLSSSTGRFLKINDQGVYNYTSGNNTSFQRIIYLEKEKDILKVKVTIRWREKGKPQSLTVQENLYGWR